MQAEHGNVRLVRGSWTEAFLIELEDFPEGNHDDQVDCFSDFIGALANLGPRAASMATTTAPRAGYFPAYKRTMF